MTFKVKKMAVVVNNRLFVMTFGRTFSYKQAKIDVGFRFFFNY